MLNQDFTEQKKKLDKEIKDFQWQNEVILLEIQKNQNVLDELKYEVFPLFFLINYKTNNDRKKEKTKILQRKLRI